MLLRLIKLNKIKFFSWFVTSCSVWKVVSDISEKPLLSPSSMINKL